MRGQLSWNAFPFRKLHTNNLVGADKMLKIRTEQENFICMVKLTQQMHTNLTISFLIHIPVSVNNSTEYVFSQRIISSISTNQAGSSHGEK